VKKAFARFSKPKKLSKLFKRTLPNFFQNWANSKTGQTSKNAFAQFLKQEKLGKRFKSTLLSFTRCEKLGKP